MSGDLPQDVHRDAGTPCQTGVPQVVATQVLVAKRGDDLIRVGRVA
jgi:hypothetical protein